MKRLPFFLILGGIIVLMSYAAPQGSGFSNECVDNQCRFVAATSLKALIFGPFLGVMIFFIPKKKIIPDASRAVGIFRRLGAIYINMFVVMLPVISALVVPMLLIEALYTGEFRWSFYREYSRNTDVLVSGLSVLIVFGLMFFYYYRALKIERPTIGQFLMGYYIDGNGEVWTRKRAWKRIGWSMLTLCIWPVTIFIALRNPDKAFWFDLKTNSLAMRFDYKD